MTGGQRTDPKIRKDGLCACGCRKQVRTDRWKRYAPDVTDPFASSNCCRLWHGLPVPGARDENYSKAMRSVLVAKYYSMADGFPDPVGETMVESRRRDTEARERLGLPLGVS